jgi:hypothetical protein
MMFTPSIQGLINGA